MDKQNNYNIINEKIKTLKEQYHSLRKKSDDIAFTALCIKSNLYKNPSLLLSEEELNEMIVDSKSDGGVDAILADPNSDTNNLVICQSKHYTKISFEDVSNALIKMMNFYKDMIAGNYQLVNKEVQKRFLLLNAEIGDESKVCFVLYTSAEKNGIRSDRIQKILKNQGFDTSRFEIQVYFAEDVVDEILEAESRRPTVEIGKIEIDCRDNYLTYNDDAIIVNVSAFSLKELYAIHSTNLLSMNLRYYIKKRDIDSAINDTIKNNPETFWFRNNGLTIICDDFDIDGKYVKLHNFSIVNGGQTTTLIHKSNEINKEHDLFLPCKIIKILGNTTDERNQFSLDIAKATNSQKAIKQIDLKSNSPEQVRFGIQMRNVNIFYQTKRGEQIPKDYKDSYKNTDLVEVGKLCLSGIFQLPGSSRSKPSSLYLEKFYNPIFNGDQIRVSKIIKELLYIDYYFRQIFIQQFDNECDNGVPNANEIIPFANNSRTICIAFAALAARYYNGNITTEKLKILFEHLGKDRAYDEYFYDIFRNIDDMDSLFPKHLFEDKDKYDSILNNLFRIIIHSGIRYYGFNKMRDGTLNETNFLKKDNNYYYILSTDWIDIATKINEVFAKFDI